MALYDFLCNNEDCEYSFFPLEIEKPMKDNSPVYCILCGTKMRKTINHRINVNLKREKMRKVKFTSEDIKKME